MKISFSIRIYQFMFLYRRIVCSMDRSDPPECQYDQNLYGFSDTINSVFCWYICVWNGSFVSHVRQWSIHLSVRGEACNDDFHASDNYCSIDKYTFVVCILFYCVWLLSIFARYILSCSKTISCFNVSISKGVTRVIT